MSMDEVHIGTSGWNYKHWQPIFYPQDLRHKDWLNFFQQHFDTVEINNTFYHLPKENTFQRWREQAPDGFLYAVKANRFITHMKKLKDCSSALENFIGRVKLLKENLGPILWQLPPHWHVNLERLEAFVDLLPKDLRHVFEFRDADWFREETRNILERHGLIFCIHDKQGLDCPQWVTAGSVYLRFHGSEGNYGGKYGPECLHPWAERIRTWMDEGRSIFAYFNNDVSGYALEDARTLLDLLKS
ncbi:MAG: DUF72 domain-containing protein [Anaerolineales bacterium]|jgi:uncharacterized protein YecE (DUF72 family)